MELVKRKTAAMMVLIVGMFFLFSFYAAADELQAPKLKQGYYFSLIPMGEMVFVDSKNNYGPWPSAGGQLRMGEALNRWFDLGVAGGASVAIGDDYRLIHGQFGAEGTVKPTQYLSFGIQAGLGFADFSRQKRGMEEVIGRFGATYGFTVGYDFFGRTKRTSYKSGGLAISAYAGVHVGPSEETSIYTIFAGIAVSWWTGLPKHKLDLPVNQAF